MTQSWTCPFCNRPTTITDNDMKTGRVASHMESDKGPVSLHVQYIVCPNTKCKKMSLVVVLISQTPEKNSYGYEDVDILQTWKLIPESTAKVYSTEIVPKAVVEDYEEACKIMMLSPKASATLARRALQGMIRDFHTSAVEKYRKEKNIKGYMSLAQEITAIKDEVEPDVWDAIDAVRDVGNIGAHMEVDVNIIIDVEPGEAQQLITLIEMLIEEWYINRHERKLRLESVVQIAKVKRNQKQTEKASTTN